MGSMFPKEMHWTRTYELAVGTCSNKDSIFCINSEQGSAVKRSRECGSGPGGFSTGQFLSHGKPKLSKWETIFPRSPKQRSLEWGNQMACLIQGRLSKTIFFSSNTHLGKRWIFTSEWISLRSLFPALTLLRSRTFNFSCLLGVYEAGA